jgi:hypothetical protein
LRTICSVPVTQSVVKKRCKAGGGVHGTLDVVKQCLSTKRGIPDAAAAAKESVRAFCRIASGIASVRRRTDRWRFWQKPDANNPDQNVNYVLKFHGYFPFLVFVWPGFNKISPACRDDSPQARIAIRAEIVRDDSWFLKKERKKSRHSFANPS